MVARTSSSPSAAPCAEWCPALLGLPQPITTKDLTSAAAGIRPSTKEWFATAKNYALYSNQGGIYDDILKYLKL